MINFINNMIETKWKHKIVTIEKCWSELKEGEKPDVGSIFVIPAEEYRQVLVRHESSEQSWCVFVKPQNTDIQCILIAGDKESAEFFAQALAHELAPQDKSARPRAYEDAEPMHNRGPQ